MYLSRLILNFRGRAVRRDLADCQALHRTVMSAFGPGPRGKNGREYFQVLYRVDGDRRGKIILYVQSQVSPDWRRLGESYVVHSNGDAENPACKSLSEALGRLESGLVVAFRLRANPTRKIGTKSGPDGRRHHGKRVELPDEERQMKWLRRKAAHGGFEILYASANPDVPAVRAIPEHKIHGKRYEKGRGDDNHPLTFGAVLFEGLLRITDVETFRQTVARGIGSGKAYGFGLLSLAPPPR